MGYKWTNIVFDVDSRGELVAEASFNPRTKEEVLYDFLRDRWDAENVNPSMNVDVMFGLPSEKKLCRWVSEVFEEFEFVTRAAAVRVTDSAYCGFGLVLEKDEDNMAKVVDEIKGVEKARGHDVTDQIKTEYNMRLDADRFW